MKKRPLWPREDWTPENQFRDGYGRSEDNYADLGWGRAVFVRTGSGENVWRVRTLNLGPGGFFVFLGLNFPEGAFGSMSEFRAWLEKLALAEIEG